MMNANTESRLRRRLTAILFADMVGYSRMMADDELATTVAIKSCIEMFSALAGDFSGKVIGTAGDGVFLVFDSAVDAVAFAVEIQNRIKKQNEGVSKDKQTIFRIGINLGEIIIDDLDLHGDSINIASRIEAFAQPGRVCISGAVHDQVSNKLSFGYEYLGAQEFKNISELVDVFQVHEDPAGATLTTGLRRPARANESARDGSSKDQSIVVLPFGFQGNDPSESWFADGLAEDVTTNLSRFHDFFVIARGSAYVYNDRSIAPKEVARELGVRYVVDGSVRKAGPRIRVALQLLDAQSDRTIWGEQYNREIEDIFDLQDEITQVIVSATAAQIEASELDRFRQQPPASLAAYGFVLQGQSHIFRYTKEEVQRARDLYNSALDLDPHYARALAAKSRTLNIDWRYDWTDRPDRALDDALSLARQAVEYDNTDARGFGELGFAHLYRKEHEAAISAYERALRLNPNDADLMSDMADALAHTGRSEEAIELLHKAMRLNPFYPDQYIWHLGGAFFNLERYEDAIRTIQTMQNPTEGRRLLAASYGNLGREAEARAEAQKVLEAHPNFSVDAWAAVQPDKYEEDVVRFVEGLKRAGL
ncbi:adenylate/guanylate cyclase domain-containing protein [Hoeflea sp. TYP-13]|uniref:adenylate/guanylate cyclase domain-containing protein n=1 Tax=Hoeflea sp. TYP-13 TaxID=3230023 RepID=UPI0034C64565